MHVTISDIAARAGVSKSLVSMHLNRRPGARLAPATRERIDSAVRELNYRPSAMAKALREGNSRTVGMVIGNITGFYTGFYIQSLMVELNKHGYQLLPSIVPHYDREEELRCLQNLIDRRVDGVIYKLRLEPTPEMERLLRGYPILQCYSRLAGYNGSIPDFAAAFETACRQLKKEHCTRILACDAFWNREASQACDAAGLKIDFAVSSGREEESFFNCCVSGKYDTLFFNDSTKVKKLLARFPGAKIPRIIYCYALPNDYIAHPAVTGGFVYDFREMVRLRVDRIIAMIEQPEPDPAVQTEPVEFITAEELGRLFRTQAADPYFGDHWKFANPVL
ncbi:MAG: LacI family DNA-binding transcriptional regulator [Lentisphaeria bacterium]|nr:LacI family DNA-binding transcriptional regulator [Lentisphaeria bacterium]